MCVRRLGVLKARMAGDGCGCSSRTGSCRASVDTVTDNSAQNKTLSRRMPCRVGASSRVQRAERPGAAVGGTITSRVTAGGRWRRCWSPRPVGTVARSGPFGESPRQQKAGGRRGQRCGQRLRPSSAPVNERGAAGSVRGLPGIHPLPSQ